MSAPPERMSAAEAKKRDLLNPKPKKNKYRAVRCECDGIKFASKAERQRYLELRQMQNDGTISHLETHPKFKLSCGDRPVLYPNGRQAVYSADFAYWNGERRVVEDVKGGKATRTEAYALRKAIVEAMHPAVKIVEVTA